MSRLERLEELEAEAQRCLAERGDLSQLLNLSQQRSIAAANALPDLLAVVRAAQVAVESDDLPCPRMESLAAALYAFTEESEA